MLLRITAPHFCAGVVLFHPFKSAPIVRYMALWSRVDVERYCARKGWTVERID